MATKVQSKYKVTNWKKYNESLVNRGDITVWFSEDVTAKLDISLRISKKQGSIDLAADSTGMKAPG